MPLPGLRQDPHRDDARGGEHEEGKPCLRTHAKSRETNARVYGAGHKLIGKNYQTPDLYAKVTGQAKYAEDYRADGMLFCKLLLSPLPHARVKHIDAREALAMPGVKAILTADDLPAPADTLTDNGTVIKANKKSERGLTMEPVYQGEPILAVAAVDELTAAEAIEKIRIDFERLPFVIDPLDTLRPGGPNPRTDGNVWVQSPTPPAVAGAPPPAPPLRRSASSSGPTRTSPRTKRVVCRWARRPTNGRMATWKRDFKNAALVLDETFVTPDTSHQTLETRTAMAYWQNGKVYVHTGTQSTAQTVPAIARWLNMDASKVVLISEYTGGGFGSKITGGVSLIIPALLVEEGQRTGDDADQPRRGDLHRASAAQSSGPDESRLLQGRAHHRARHVRDFRQRSLRRRGRRPIIRPHRLALVSAASHALARSRRF